jgi:uncharacterized protein (UPF0261 family)
MGDTAPAGRVYVAGTCDTKGRELGYVRDLIAGDGVAAVLVDISTSGVSATGDITAAEVATHHPGGAAAVFRGERGASVAAMAVAFARFIATRGDVAGLIGLGGSGNTSLVTRAMQALPVGVPKLMVSTVASGNVSAYVGPSDIAMMYSVTDIAGLNRISRRVLANAAHAIAGMARARPPAPVPGDDRPAIGVTMFGVTTPCVAAVTQALEAEYDCLVFHATGTGGASMEKLADSGLLAGVIDVTTTEVADMLVGGMMACTEDRLGAIARTRVPYVGSCGALDMVNFGARATVPERFDDRHLYVHNPQVTLMRTTPEECDAIGAWIGERLNRCEGPVRFVIPMGGVSAIDVPGQAFHDPRADAALFDALAATIEQTDRRRLLRLPYAINDPAFAAALVEEFRAVMAEAA